MDSKKKKILIGAGIGTFILVTLFAFLIFNHDKDAVSPNEPNTAKAASKNTPSETAAPKESNKNEQTSLEKAPFKEVYFNGNPVEVQPGDINISQDGKVLISSDLLSGKLNLPVSWKGNAVYIGEQPVEGTNEVGMFLSDMDYLKFYAENSDDFVKDSKIYLNKWEDKTAFSVAGTQYQKGIGWNLEYPFFGGYKPLAYFVDYNLAGKYKTFKTEIGVDDQFKDKVSSYIAKVYGDDKLLFTSAAFKGGDFAIPVEVDVSNVIRLKLEVNRVDDKNSEDERDTKIVFGNPVLK